MNNKDERKEMFTPGPWEVSPVDSGIVRAVSGQYVAETRPTSTARIQNALLMAAAPRMYGDIVKLLSLVGKIGSMMTTEEEKYKLADEAVEIAVASLKNARGENV